jgi:NitT/TauT family transport system permease protein
MTGSAAETVIQGPLDAGGSLDTGAPIGGDPGPAARAVRAIRYYLPAVLVALSVIVIWQVAVTTLSVQRFILPAPSAIVKALVENWNLLVRSTMNTLYEAVGGFIIGATAGIAVAFITSRWVSIRDMILPAAIAANAIPIVAMAPIFNNWFGVINPLSKMMMAAVLVFMPVMINVTRGLTQVEPAVLELARSYAASERTILHKIRIPNMLPYLLTALKIGTTLSLIGAIVGEYFGGSSEVLGRIVVRYASSLQFDVTWAAILLAAGAGVLFYSCIAIAERVLIPWHASQRSSEP